MASVVIGRAAKKTDELGLMPPYQLSCVYLWCFWPGLSFYNSTKIVSILGYRRRRKILPEQFARPSRSRNSDTSQATPKATELQCTDIRYLMAR